MKHFITILLTILVFEGKALDKDPISLYTDRDVYTSGETALFQILTPSGVGNAILHLNLINTQGKIISKASRKVANEQANGYLYLPDSLKTDNYLLCASLNDNPEMVVKELFICNRFTGLTGITNIQRAKEIEAVTDYPTDGIIVEGVMPVYKTRDKGHLSIRLNPDLLTQARGSLFVAVTEADQGFGAQSFVRRNEAKAQKSLLNEEITVNGFVSNPETGEPFKNANIFLSVPDSIPWLSYVNTDANGYFHFQLKNYFGKFPIVVQATDADKKQLVKIRLEKNDSLLSAIPKLEQLPVPTEIQKNFETAMDAATLRKIFNLKEVETKTMDAVKRHEYSFYGVPTETVYPALFVDLPDFTEISRELLPGVKFRAFNRIPTLQILNPATLNFFADPPLVTLDGVPVHDLNVIKNMGSRDIQRIEICRKERFYGDLAFPGVVAIYSTKPDYKRLIEANDLVKSEVEGIQPEAELFAPKEHKKHEPDLRKVLVWKPEIQLTEKNEIEFNTSDIAGHYQVVVRIKTKDGKSYSKVQKFEVK